MFEMFKRTWLQKYYRDNGSYQFNIDGSNKHLLIVKIESGLVYFNRVRCRIKY